MNIATAASLATAVITTVIAALVAVITWRQWITNRARLRHELFDRRYAIYEQVSSFIATVLQTGRVEPGAEVEFLRHTKRAYFAFGCDETVKQLLDEIYKQTILLQTLEAKEKGLPSGAILDSNVDKQERVRQWFSTTLMSLEQRFEKYLRLEH